MKRLKELVSILEVIRSRNEAERLGYENQEHSFYRKPGANIDPLLGKNYFSLETNASVDRVGEGQEEKRHGVGDISQEVVVMRVRKKVMWSDKTVAQFMVGDLVRR